MCLTQSVLKLLTLTRRKGRSFDSFFCSSPEWFSQQQPACLTWPRPVRKITHLMATHSTSCRRVCSTHTHCFGTFSDHSCMMSWERTHLWIMAGMYDFSLSTDEDDKRAIKRPPPNWKVDPKFCTPATVNKTSRTFDLSKFQPVLQTKISKSLVAGCRHLPTFLHGPM